MFSSSNVPPFQTSLIMEPFRVKVVEPISFITREERINAIKKADYNVFKLASSNIIIDLLTDSGTNAMSQNQWSAMMLGDNSYAYSQSWFKFEKSIRNLTNFKYIYPCHQGRAAERLLFDVILKQSNQIIPGNTHFDTTRANIEYRKCIAKDFIINEANDINNEYNFKGNINIELLRNYLLSLINYDTNRIHEIKEKYVPCIILTVTNNSGGGQPISLSNMKQLKQLSIEFNNIPLFIDCARFAENAWFIKHKEEGQSHRTCKDISKEMFSLFDGALMSMKKDGLCNIGGFLALNNDQWAQEISQLEILSEGFTTYGGLSGRDLEALAIGIEEVLDEEYLNYRMATSRYLFNKLDQFHIPMLRPCGGHAVYLNGSSFLSHIPLELLPSQLLSIAIYIEGGIRCCEIGTTMFGQTNVNTGLQIPSKMDLVRLALPRRVYTQSHVDYIIEVISYIYKYRKQIPYLQHGLTITKETPYLRHFTCNFKLLE